jgi:hypothetical protein
MRHKSRRNTTIQPSSEQESQPDQAGKLLLFYIILLFISATCHVIIYDLKFIQIFIYSENSFMDSILSNNFDATKDAGFKKFVHFLMSTKTVLCSSNRASEAPEQRSGDSQINFIVKQFFIILTIIRHTFNCST